MADRLIAPMSAADNPLQRSTQTLPVPLGGLAPVRRNASALRRTIRRHRSAPLLALSLAAALSGVWVSTSPRSFNAGQDGVGVHVDGITLTPVGRSIGQTHIFTGAATLVVTTSSTGILRAGAVMTWNGQPTTGRCELVSHSSVARETCKYNIGANHLTSSDSYSSRTRTWHRRYGDGAVITIAVPSGSTPIPMPFPLGR